MNADGTNQTQLTHETGWQSAAPDWSPDGAKIVFQSSRDSTGTAFNNEIYVMNADGTHSPVPRRAVATRACDLKAGGRGLLSGAAALMI
jgi:Tol biopolymer transport system component